ncbi:thioesterase [Micromonospora craterilacus]|uniref:Thioesterase n=1 Tax=Micromonospora craterilacus TaxID=1655439 RepID=A0A2W2EC15_9ACTN|nr:thioesterase [Micromonospora craterilacus]
MTARPQGNPWLRRFHDVPTSRLTLVCFPHAGGSAGFFHPMSASAKHALQVVALQYPGRQDRSGEPLLTTLSELADQAYDALRPLMGRPLAFFGHSMGATLAFEVAVRMRQRLENSPVALFASGSRAPCRPRLTDAVHLRDDNGLVAELAALNGTDPRLLREPDLLRIILPVLRADYMAVETYRYEVSLKLDCPIIALVGDADSKVEVADARAWREHSTGPFELRTFPGGHFYLTDHRTQITDLVINQLLYPA